MTERLVPRVRPTAARPGSAILVGALVGLAVVCAPVLRRRAFAQSPFQRIHGFEPHFVAPPAADFANVRTEFGAKGDGVTDDTAAFKAAIEGAEPRTVFIPAGTYLIRDQLRFGEQTTGTRKRTLLIGESRGGTILSLADGSPGFGDPAKPKVFVHTRKSAQQGEQNFSQYLYHLTIEIGRNNPGAIALNFHTNNTGMVKDVTVRAVDPDNHRGLRGIAFDDYWFGPGGARYIDVEGFTECIFIGSAHNHTTLEHVSLRKCGVGLTNNGNGVSVRDLATEACGTAIKNAGAGGHMALVEAKLVDGRGPDAVVNEGRLFARQVETAGYTRAVRSSSAGGDQAGPQVESYVSHPVIYNWPPGSGLDRSLALPVEESPEYQYPQSVADWAVTPASGDISAAVQGAIDAGKKTVYVRGGDITRTIVLRGNVERIMGTGVKMMNLMTATTPAFRLEGGAPPAVIVELLYPNYGSTSQFILEQAAPRAVVLRHGGGAYRTADGGRGGKVFVESVVGIPFEFRGVSAWVRDLNTEGGGHDRPNVTNDGGRLWILGTKTEAYSVKLRMLGGGFTELLGASYKQNWDARHTVEQYFEANPLFLLVDSHASLSFRTFPVYAGAADFKYLVRETRTAETRNLVHRAHGGMYDGTQPLFVGYAARLPAPPAGDGGAGTPDRGGDAAPNQEAGARRDGPPDGDRNDPDGGGGRGAQDGGQQTDGRPPNADGGAGPGGKPDGSAGPSAKGGGCGCATLSGGRGRASAVGCAGVLVWLLAVCRPRRAASAARRRSTRGAPRWCRP